MKNFEVGQKVRVVGDTFKHDPHGVPVGEEVDIEKIIPEIPFEEFPPMIKLVFAMSGRREKFDLPTRARVKYGEVGFTNIPLTDIEPVSYEPKKVRMLEDDFFEGYEEGDILEAFYSETKDEYMFTDKDGDVRFLVDHNHEEIK